MIPCRLTRLSLLLAFTQTPMITRTCFLVIGLLLPVGLRAQEMAIPDIAFEKFTLDNGLTVIVHEDHKAPLVAVNLWYHVGSKNEPFGRSGFAHLFEHLMFNGSENFNDDYFQVLERIGATDLNGTTNQDRTNYFQTVPVNAVELALWMESDRMGHLLGAIDQAKLDEQRGVVQNEKRQGENQPYGQVYNRITNATYPEGHPYAHTVIGSMEDLNAATLEDVYDWFRAFYGPNNAVVSVAGAITVDHARGLVEKYFGDIPPGPPVSRFDTWVAKRSGKQRETLQDRVPQARIYKVWNVPEVYSKEYHQLELAADVLASGKNSRFYKRLVYTDQTATSVSAYVSGGEIGSQFVVEATARPGVDLTSVESALDEELALLLADGPTPAELERVRVQEKASFIRGMERIGGFGGKSDILASSQIYGGAPDAYKRSFTDKDAASPEDVRQAAAEWLSDGVYVLEVHPFPTLAALEEGADRASLPEAGPEPAVSFPELHYGTLSNGLNVVLAHRDAVPTVGMTLQVDAGYAADHGIKPGTAQMTMNMLDEGTKTRTSLQINEDLADLGATLVAGSNLDGSSVTLTTLTAQLGPSLDVFADVILNPSFPEADFERLRNQQLASIQAQKSSPIQMALRVFPALFYGEGHAYSLPFTGSGNEESVASLTLDDLRNFHSSWFKPNNATLAVVGNITLDELMPRLEERFGQWAAGDVPKKNVAEVAHAAMSRVYLMDRPQAQQSVILAGHLAPPRNAPDNIGIETMNTILGGAFISRINMNLREEKGWSYGASSLLLPARGQRPFLVYAPVQTDKTKESIQEILLEIENYIGDLPPTEDEVLTAQQNQTLALPGLWETNSSVRVSILDLVQYDLPEDYHDTYAEQVRALTLDQVAAAAKDVLHPEKLIWVVVGDLSVIEPGIRELGFDEVIQLDADGNIIN